MLDMRIRLPELLTEKRTNAHALAVKAQKSNKRLALNTVYKLVAKRGVVTYLDARTLDAIADALEITDMNELISRDPPPPRVKRKRA